MTALGTVLHVGCGIALLPDWLKCASEVRLDLDPRYQPDIVADMRELGEIGPFDGVYCQHALEHLNRADAVKTLKGFRRVLHPGGVAVITVPDLEDIKPNDQVIYKSPAGPVTGADMYFGMQSMLKDFPMMAHQFGYVKRTLRQIMEEAGFREVSVERREVFELLATGVA